MKEKYLPIGTVCNIKGNTNSVMIAGYLGFEYNGNFNLYDYKGLVYPGGMLNDSVVLFNHDDIEKVVFEGYKSDLYNNLNSNLANANVIEAVSKKTKNENTNRFVFDSNGVIIMDNTVSEDVVSMETPVKTNPFAMEYKQSEVKENVSKFKFDENGVIIEDGTVTEEKVNTTSPFEFDRNGFIIEDNSYASVPAEEEKVENVTSTSTSGYKFDENGVIIEDNSAKEDTPKKGKYEFDENGVIIAEN